MNLVSACPVPRSLTPYNASPGDQHETAIYRELSMLRQPRIVVLQSDISVRPNNGASYEERDGLHPTASVTRAQDIPTA